MRLGREGVQVPTQCNLKNLPTGEKLLNVIGQLTQAYGEKAVQGTMIGSVRRGDRTARLHNGTGSRTY